MPFIEVLDGPINKMDHLNGSRRKKRRLEQDHESPSSPSSASLFPIEIVNTTRVYHSSNNKKLKSTTDPDADSSLIILTDSQDSLHPEETYDGGKDANNVKNGKENLRSNGSNHQSEAYVGETIDLSDDEDNAEYPAKGINETSSNGHGQVDDFVPGHSASNGNGESEPTVEMKDKLRVKRNEHLNRHASPASTHGEVAIDLSSGDESSKSESNDSDIQMMDHIMPNGNTNANSHTNEANGIAHNARNGGFQDCSSDEEVYGKMSTPPVPATRSSSKSKRGSRVIRLQTDSVESSVCEAGDSTDEADDPQGTVSPRRRLVTTKDISPVTEAVENDPSPTSASSRASSEVIEISSSEDEDILPTRKTRVRGARPEAKEKRKSKRRQASSTSSASPAPPKLSIRIDGTQQKPTTAYRSSGKIDTSHIFVDIPLLVKSAPHSAPPFKSVHIPFPRPQPRTKGHSVARTRPITSSLTVEKLRQRARRESCLNRMPIRTQVPRPSIQSSLKSAPVLSRGSTPSPPPPVNYIPMNRTARTGGLNVIRASLNQDQHASDQVAQSMSYEIDLPQQFNWPDTLSKSLRKEGLWFHMKRDSVILQSTSEALLERGRHLLRRHVFGQGVLEGEKDWRLVVEDQEALGSRIELYEDGKDSSGIFRLRAFTGSHDLPKRPGPPGTMEYAERNSIKFRVKLTTPMLMMFDAARDFLKMVPEALTSTSTRHTKAEIRAVLGKMSFSLKDGDRWIHSTPFITVRELGQLLESGCLKPIFEPHLDSRVFRELVNRAQETCDVKFYRRSEVIVATNRQASKWPSLSCRRFSVPCVDDTFRYEDSAISSERQSFIDPVCLNFLNIPAGAALQIPLRCITPTSAVETLEKVQYSKSTGLLKTPQPNQMWGEQVVLTSIQRNRMMHSLDWLLGGQYADVQHLTCHLDTITSATPNEKENVSSKKVLKIESKKLRKSVTNMLNGTNDVQELNEEIVHGLMDLVVSGSHVLDAIYHSFNETADMSE